MKKYIIISLLIFLFDSAAVAQHKEFAWLVGTWKLKDKNVFETWKVSSDLKSLEGSSYKSHDGDSITITETMQLKSYGNLFYYVPDVAGEQKPVDFKITKHDKESFVAENPNHDFPKIIRYRFMKKGNEDQIEASIEGDGKIISYRFERVK